MFYIYYCLLLNVMDDWKLKTSPVVRLERSTFVYFVVFPNAAFPRLKVGRLSPETPRPTVATGTTFGRISAVFQRLKVVGYGVQI